MPFFFTALVSYQEGKEYFRWIAFSLFVTAAVSDAVDGFLARLLKQKTRLGRMLDPLADKLLLLSGYLGLLCVRTLPLQPPLWITVTIVFRDLVLLTGLLIVFLMSSRLPVKPNFLGKLTTAFQAMTLVLILLQWQLAIPFWYVTAGLTMISCAVYVIRELRQLHRETS